jgi:hypothetical protein
MTTKHKYNLFEVLAKASTKNAEYYDNLPEDQQKQIQPLLIQRWMSGTDSAKQVFLINEIVNPFVFSLYKHPKLLWKLLTITAPGNSKKYKWMSQKSEAGTKKPTSTAVVAEYYGYNSRHARDAVNLMTYDQVVELASSLGYQQDTITKIKKELDANGRTK